MPPGEEHHPSHQFGPVGIESLCGLPEPQKDLLYGVLSLRIGGQQLAGSAEHEASKAVIELRNGGFVTSRHPLHQFEIVVDSTELL